MGISKRAVRQIEVWGNSIVNLNMAGIEGIEFLVNPSYLGLGYITPTKLLRGPYRR